MTLADLQPDVALKALLEGKVKAKSASGAMVPLKVFADGEHGNKDADDEYIEILYNGLIGTDTEDKTKWKGHLALYLQCKLQTDTRVKISRMTLIQNQIEPLLENKPAKVVYSQGYKFELDEKNPVSKPQRNYSTGYAYAIYNVAWRYNSLSEENINR